MPAGGSQTERATTNGLLNESKQQPSLSWRTGCAALDRLGDRFPAGLPAGAQALQGARRLPGCLRRAPGGEVIQMVFGAALTMCPGQVVGAPDIFYNSSRSYLSPREGAPIMYGTARPGGSPQGLKR